VPASSISADFAALAPKVFWLRSRDRTRVNLLSFFEGYYYTVAVYEMWRRGDYLLIE
jgi:hypothetical protein